MQPLEAFLLTGEAGMLICIDSVLIIPLPCRDLRREGFLFQSL